MWKQLCSGLGETDLTAPSSERTRPWRETERWRDRKTERQREREDRRCPAVSIERGSESQGYRRGTGSYLENSEDHWISHWKDGDQNGSLTQQLDFFFPSAVYFPPGSRGERRRERSDIMCFWPSRRLGCRGRLHLPPPSSSTSSPTRCHQEGGAGRARPRQLQGSQHHRCTALDADTVSRPWTDNTTTLS